MAEYPLHIKASIDTSQVERQLKNLKAPSSLTSSFGGQGQGGQGQGGQANKEIVNAAKAINLQKLAQGVNLFGRQLDRLSQTTGNTLLKNFSDLSQSATGAIQAFRAFGAPGAAIFVATEAINAWANAVMEGVDVYNRANGVIANIARERRGEVAQDRYANMSDEELKAAHGKAEQNLENARDTETAVARKARQASELLADPKMLLAWRKRGELKSAIADAMGRASQGTSDAKSTLAAIEAEMARRSASAPEVDYTEQGASALDQFFEDLRAGAEISKEEYEAFAAVAADAEDRLNGYNSMLDEGMTLSKEQVSRIEELAGAYKDAKEHMERYEQQQEAKAQEEKARQEEEAAEAARHESTIQSQNKFFEGIDFKSQLGVYESQIGSLSDTQRANMEKRRGVYEAENAQLRQAAERGEEIDLGKFQENMRRIEDITSVLSQDAEAKKSAEEDKGGEDLPSWLDGMDSRTDDWFHNIGGSVGGENSIENQEFRLMQEIANLVRNLDQTQTQMNTAIQS